ncbi:MAG TPA: hypothetical protein VIG52_09865 [Methyloceanibacter sp.]
MTIQSRALRALLCVTAALTLIAGVPASVLAEYQADDNRLDEAWKDAIGDQENILTEQQFAMLNNLAFQAAVTKVCDGFDLDQAKFAKAITDATTPLPNPDMSEEDIKVWETAVIMRLGATYGVLLAEGNTRPEQFCASAKELKADTDVPNVWQ